MRLTALALIACAALFVSGCGLSSKTGEAPASECNAASSCAMSQEECSAMKMKTTTAGDCSAKKAGCASQAAPE